LILEILQLISEALFLTLRLLSSNEAKVVVLGGIQRRHLKLRTEISWSTILYGDIKTGMGLEPSLLKLHQISPGCGNSHADNLVREG